MPLTVHIVEDDRSINEVVCEYMKEAGFLVVSSEHGADALRTIRQRGDISLFILDIMLPEISGLELLREIRSIDAYKETPVVMLTALGDEATQLMSFDELADDYVTKPFSPKVLVRRVQALLRRGGAGEKTLRHDGIKLDYGSFEAWEGERKLSLTLREFELLGTLMQNTGKALSRQQLLNYAWGYDYFGDERVVDVHIKNLRKKLGSNVISTIIGVGYKFGGE